MSTCRFHPHGRRFVRADNGTEQAAGDDTYAFQYGANLTTDPAGCVRAPYNQWYAHKSTCEQSLPPNYECNPRYINGVWPEYHPYARDTVQCHGVVPPDVLPQRLNNQSVVEAQAWYPLSDVTLDLMKEGRIADFSYVLNVEGNMVPKKILFTQDMQTQASVFDPLLYIYYNKAENAQLEINASNGYAKLLWPVGNGPAIVRFVMTNIPSPAYIQ